MSRRCLGRRRSTSPALRRKVRLLFVRLFVCLFSLSFVFDRGEIGAFFDVRDLFVSRSPAFPSLSVLCFGILSLLSDPTRLSRLFRLRARRHRVHEGEQADVDEDAIAVRLLLDAVLQAEPDRALGGELGRGSARRSN